MLQAEGLSRRLGLIRRVTAGVFRDIEATVKAWRVGRRKICVVPAPGTLTPAQDVPRSSGDWQNEIHPNRTGWRRLVKVGMPEILVRLP